MQNITMKTQDRTIRTPLKTGGEIECSGRVAVPSPLVTSVVLNHTLLSRRIYMCCDFVDNSYVKDSYIPVLQSLSVLSEDITNVTFENPIYHRVRGGICQKIEISMRDDNLKICRFKDDISCDRFLLSSIRGRVKPSSKESCSRH
jgi:hypothetical protein